MNKYELLKNNYRRSQQKVYKKTKIIITMIINFSISFIIIRWMLYGLHCGMQVQNGRQGQQGGQDQGGGLHDL